MLMIPVLSRGTTLSEFKKDVIGINEVFEAQCMAQLTPGLEEQRMVLRYLPQVNCSQLRCRKETLLPNNTALPTKPQAPA